MVQLEEVKDEDLNNPQPGPADDGDWDTDDESETSSILSDEAADESLVDRIAALKDVIPPAQRRQISNNLAVAQDWSWWGFSNVCKGAWLVGVSALLLGIPFAVGQAEDQMIAMEEKGQSMQQSANDVLAPGASSSPQTQQSL